MTDHARTVADAMLRHPTLHPADLSVGAARAALAVSPKTHLLLLVDDDGVLVSTLSRRDVEAGADPQERAATLGSLVDRTVRPEALLEPVRAAMVGADRRRLAVVDPTMRLLGLLCLKRARTGFCTDDGVAAMRRSRVGHSPAATDLPGSPLRRAW